MNKHTSYRTGYDALDIHLTHDAQGWFYDGPVTCGPREVRRSGRGPCWCGSVSPQFAGALLKKLKAANLLIGDHT